MKNCAAPVSKHIEVAEDDKLQLKCKPKEVATAQPAARTKSVHLFMQPRKIYTSY